MFLTKSKTSLAKKYKKKPKQIKNESMKRNMSNTISMNEIFLVLRVSRNSRHYDYPLPRNGVLGEETKTQKSYHNFIGNNRIL